MHFLFLSIGKAYSMKMKIRILSILLIPTLIVACILPYSDSSAATYIDNLTLSDKEIILNETMSFNFTGHIRHKTRGSNQGLFPKLTDLPSKITIKCTWEECPDDSSYYQATFDIKTEALKDPKIKMKKVKAIADDVIGNTVSPYTFTTTFDCETGENLELSNYKKVSVEQSESKETRYPLQWFRYSLPGESKLRKSAVYTKKSWRFTYTVTYPKTCKDVCVGIGSIDLKDRDFEYETREDDGWFEGEIEFYGDSMYYSKAYKNTAYIHLPYDE